MPPTHARVVASSDPAARHYVGHMGTVVRVSVGNAARGQRTLLLLEFANGEREVFCAEELAPMDEGDAPTPAPEAKALKLPKPGPTLRPKRPRVPAAPPGYCVHGHVRAKPNAKCGACDRAAKARRRDARRQQAAQGENL